MPEEVALFPIDKDLRISLVSKEAIDIAPVPAFQPHAGIIGHIRGREGELGEAEGIVVRDAAQPLEVTERPFLHIIGE